MEAYCMMAIARLDAGFSRTANGIAMIEDMPETDRELAQLLRSIADGIEQRADVQDDEEDEGRWGVEP